MPPASHLGMKMGITGPSLAMRAELAQSPMARGTDPHPGPWAQLRTRPTASPVKDPILPPGGLAPVGGGHKTLVVCKEVCVPLTGAGQAGAGSSSLPSWPAAIDPARVNAN